jgi:hypothetical protein
MQSSAPSELPLTTPVFSLKVSTMTLANPPVLDCIE